MKLREWLEYVAEGDVAPTAEQMRSPRRGEPHVKTAKRSTHRVDSRTSHEVAEELHRFKSIATNRPSKRAQRTRRFTK